MKNQVPKNVTERYFAELFKMNDGSFKINWAERKTQINQHVSKWKQTDARELARDLNKSQLVIK
jgi:hypothetical protein